MQSFESITFSAEQILQYLENKFVYKLVSRLTLCQGIRRCIHLGQLVEVKNIQLFLSCAAIPASDNISNIDDFVEEGRERCGELSSPQVVTERPSRNPVPIDACVYSINPLFKGLEYESAVLCTSLHGVFIQIFPSVAETSDCFQIDEELVRKLCHGIAKKTLGISLRYASDMELRIAIEWKQQQNSMSTSNGLESDPCLWLVEDAWKIYKPETKSQSRKRLQKEVHGCVEV